MLMNRNSISHLVDLLHINSPSVTFLANIERIDVRKKLNLAEFEKLTGGDDFTEQLIAFEQHNYSFAQFFENIVKEKGIPHLRSIAIKMVAEELFDSEYIREDKTGKLKNFKTSAIQLANFLKDFSDELGESQDDAYLSGLFFYLPKLAKVIVADESQGFEESILNNFEEYLGSTLSRMGFSSFITTMVSDSQKDFQSVSFPLAQALARIGLKAYDLISQEGRSALSDWYPERQMLDIVGLGRRQIFEIIKKQVSKH